MPISATRKLMTGGKGTPKIDLGGCVLYLPLYRPEMVARGGSIINGNGTMDVSPQALAVGANTITVTAAGTLIVTMPEGGTVASGTMTVTGSPVTVNAGIATTITTTGAVGNITVTPSNIIRSKDNNNSACTITGATWGKYGRTFDNVDDVITIPYNVAFRTAHFTGGCWYKPTSTPATIKGLISFGGASDGFALNVNQNKTGDASARIANGWLYDTAWRNTNCQSTLITAGFYTRLDIRYDGVTFDIFLNGAYFIGQSVTGTIAWAGTPNLTIGTAGNGVINDVLWYNRALSAGEIMNIYLATKWRYA